MLKSLKKLFRSKSRNRTLKKWSNTSLPPVESMESFLRSAAVPTTATRRSGRPPLHPGKPKGGPGPRNITQTYPKIHRQPVRPENKMLRFPAPSASAFRNHNNLRIRGKSLKEIRRMMNMNNFGYFYNSLTNDEKDILAEIL